MMQTHREAYPEQYSHSRVGQHVRAMDGTQELARGVIERVVSSRFGEMAYLASTDPEQGIKPTFYLLSACIQEPT